MNERKTEYPESPLLARRALLRFLRDDLAEEVLGDLEEKFLTTARERSALRAKINYWYQVLSYLRPFAMRKSRWIMENDYDMFRNYFKISLRNLVRQKLYSVINIGGLALGLTCVIIILLYVQHEFSYNRFYPNADRIYRAYQKQSGNVFLGTDYFAVMPAQLASVMREEIPEVTDATCVQGSMGLITVNDNHSWQKGLAVDDHFFQVFPTPFVAGNPKAALPDAKSIVLTRTLAKTFFGDRDPVGQSVQFSMLFQNEGEYHVTAVVDDPPANSSLQYAYVIDIRSSQNYMDDMKRTGWNNNSFFTFFTLRDGNYPADVEKKFPALLKKYRLPEDYEKNPLKYRYFVTPLTDIYFHSNINFDIGAKGNKQAVYLFSAVAFIVLLLACANYMNLAVARSIKRSREVGLRKVVGAVRRQLIVQFLSESILIACVSLILAVGLTYLVLPYFGQIMERPIAIDLTSNPWLLPGLLLLVLLVGFLSGSYPAFAMSSLKPIAVLKVKNDVRVSGFSLQRSLIVIQFAASITLVISSVIIYQQLDFIHRKELGYDKEDVITLWLKDPSLLGKFETLSHEWLQDPHVLAATTSTSLPSNINSSTAASSKPDAREQDKIAIYQTGAGYDYLDVFGIKLVAGRTFSRDIPNDDKDHYLLNETAAKAFGWTPEEAIGKQIYLDTAKTIVGVVKDFHMHSMHLPIQPLMIRLERDWGSFFSVKIKPGSTPEVLTMLQRSIKKYSAYPFEYQLLEDNFNDLYQSEMKLGEIFGFFTVVSILIASLGLFGLAAFLSGQRTKEIGIRKVLGASVRGIVLLLSKDFLRLVALAFVLAVPIGWYIMHQWLQDFAYRIPIEWWMFALAGSLAFLIATFSIGYQSLKASVMNPVDSLRSE